MRPSATFEGVLRSLLLALGVDHTFIDFLGTMLIGSTAVLIAIIFVAFRTRRSPVANRRTVFK
jgi:hypothetical protein